MGDGTVVGEELLEASGEPGVGKESAYPYPTPQGAARANRIIALRCSPFTWSSMIMLRGTFRAVALRELRTHAVDRLLSIGGR